MTDETTVSLNGKVALVTGSARGLGFEIAKQLGLCGARVIIGSRESGRATTVASDLKGLGITVSALKLDVTSEDDRLAAFTTIDADYGKLDILINNAGVLLDSVDAGVPAKWRPSETPVNVLRETFEANFFAPVLLTQRLLPLLKRSEAGRIVNLASIRGSLTHLSDPDSPVYPGHALAYDSSKVALNAFTVLLGEELRDTSIKVNAIHPGWLRTEMGGKNADLSVEEGARTVVQYACLADDGPTAGFFSRDERMPW
ncbi:SDR family NAD(P)-dependent oxidoreductase [Pseudomonas sp. NFR16]|uniref:SDR family NAD(P)-dependent oxidoreductase n=1 Tax=Pseudomonas sp. NFR16 TaxID=1566248 RepID=UPI0008AE89A3|nr:SDR family NAD(P)-dependent oxidoreductase [Pseudomonas sp. NFR16]SEI42595.1 NAD(P)-dependent dehydrogenase, short-chain alcohol dehydrogenase family [Pseudomonas sp. NFR16]